MQDSPRSATLDVALLSAEEAEYRVLEAPTASGDPLVLKCDDQFGVFDRWGDILPTDRGGGGVYLKDTRRLSRWELRLFGERPLLLNSGDRSGPTITTDLANPDFYAGGRIKLPRNLLHIGRTKFMTEKSCFERLLIRNFSLETLHVSLSLGFDADFADIFEVRGHPRSARGRVSIRAGADVFAFDYVALDRVRSSTTVRLDPVPTRVVDANAVYEFFLQPKEVRKIVVEVRLDEEPSLDLGADFGALLDRRHAAEQDRRNAAAKISCSDPRFDAVIEQARSDLQLLTTRTEHGDYPYAGVPWYSTVFGRDGIITALFAGWIDPALSRGVLRVLAATQADAPDPASDAQPGKIVHEIRYGEMARMKEVPFARYYGTVDATPLFIVLAAAYVRQTGDLEMLAEIWSNLERADRWIDDYGDIDGDGFVEYQAETERGLANQGWKDSSDSIFHADGRLAEGPIALCEVQAYVHLAKLDLAQLARLMDKPDVADRLEAQAHALRARFDDAFWLDDLQTYALALDGKKRPCRVRSSNAGHALFGGLALESRVPAVERTIMAPESFCAWGVRTIPSDAVRYNPMAYHNGSIWPHDNAMIALGLGRYGRNESVVKLLSALYDASLHMNLYRLPELYCGFSHGGAGQGPTLYPVACSPQAWASASLLGILKAALGLRFDAKNRTLLLDRPALPSFIDELSFTDLRVGGDQLDLTLRREGNSVAASVPRRTGDVDVVVIH